MRNAEKLNFMVNDLLDIGKAESGKLVLDNRMAAILNIQHIRIIHLRLHKSF